MSVRFRFDARRVPPPACWFVTHAITNDIRPLSECDGQLVRCHLLPQQLLKQTSEYQQIGSYAGRHHFLYQHGTWVWGCGGPTGIGGHHGQFDGRIRIRVPRMHIPSATELLAIRLGLVWYLDRTFGSRRCTAA